MKQLVNDIYTAPMSAELKSHILNDLGFGSEDKAIIKSLMDHNADSNYHYDNTGIGRERFERRLNSINRVILPEIIRLASLQIVNKTTA